MTDISLKEFVERIEKRLDERLDKIESKIDALSQSTVTEARLQSKITPLAKVQEKYGKWMKDQDERMDGVERFLFLLKVVGGPIVSIITALIIAKLSGLI